MKKETRFKFNGYLTQLATLNGVPVSGITSKYTAEPSVAQTLETKIQESSSFLQKINIIPVDEQSGERLGLGIGASIAGNTDTTQKDREPVDKKQNDGTTSTKPHTPRLESRTVWGFQAVMGHGFTIS